MKYKYEIFISENKDGKYHEFESNWQYAENNKLFIEKDSKKFKLIILKITHDINDNHDIHRLICQITEYEKK